MLELEVKAHLFPAARNAMPVKLACLLAPLTRGEKLVPTICVRETQIPCSGAVHVHEPGVRVTVLHDPCFALTIIERISVHVMCSFEPDFCIVHFVGWPRTGIRRLVM